MSHDPTLAHDLSFLINDREAFIERIKHSVYVSHVKGLRGQLQSLEIACKCVDENVFIERWWKMFLLQDIRNEFNNIFTRVSLTDQSSVMGE